MFGNYECLYKTECDSSLPEQVGPRMRKSMCYLMLALIFTSSAFVMCKYFAVHEVSAGLQNLNAVF